MPDINRSHTFTFTIYGTTTLDALVTELQNAAQVMGAGAMVSVSHYAGDQRDGSSTTFTISKPPR